MGGELVLRVAAGARLSVTDTIGTPSPHRAVVLLDFAYSGGLEKFDTDG
jgi:hypothetical protein